MPPNEAPQTLNDTERKKTLKCLPGLAVRPFSHWDVMECGTLNKTEALCGDIDLLPFHSGMRVPIACCMCGGRRRCCKLQWGWLHCCIQSLLLAIQWGGEFTKIYINNKKTEEMSNACGVYLFVSTVANIFLVYVLCDVHVIIA